MKTKYTATLPSGQVLSVTSVRPVVECHVAINRETGSPGGWRWTTKRIAKASAASCGYSLGYVRGGWCKDEKEINAAADAWKAKLDARNTYHIIPAVASK